MKTDSPDPLLHGSFFPVDIYPGDRVTAQIRHENSDDKWTECRVWRISPLGIEILQDDVRLLEPSASVSLSLSLGDITSLMWGVVANVREQEKGNILSIRFVDNSPSASYDGEDRRSKPRWICSEHFHPTCVWAHPARFNEFVYARVKDISPEGLRLSTSLRNKFIVKGALFDSILNLPLVGQLSARFQVENISIQTENGRDYLSLGVSFDDLSKENRTQFGQYLSQFARDVTPRDLARYGFAPSSAKNAVSFSFVRAEEEYREVLELRHRTYSAAGKVPSDISSGEMGTSYDTRSRILIGTYGGKIVATASLVFHEYHDQMEIEESIDWPPSFPRKENCVEVIRTCTDPSFRGTDLLLGLFHHIALTVAQAGRRYIVFGTTPTLLPVYENIGMTATDIAYEHSTLNRAKHQIVIGDIPTVLSGKTLNPIFWNAVWGDLTEHMLRSGHLKLNRLDILRVRFYRLFRPLAWLTTRWMKKPRVVTSNTKSQNYNRV